MISIAILLVGTALIFASIVLMIARNVSPLVLYFMGVIIAAVGWMMPVDVGTTHGRYIIEVCEEGDKVVVYTGYEGDSPDASISLSRENAAYVGRQMMAAGGE
jgi:hypothetical protein